MAGGKARLPVNFKNFGKRRGSYIRSAELPMAGRSATHSYDDGSSLKKILEGNSDLCPLLAFQAGRYYSHR
jgi:hypothetical protein